MSALQHVTHWRFTADQVLEMVANGILQHDAPVELIEGELVEVPPQGPEHGSITSWLHERLLGAYGTAFHVRSQTNFVADAHSLPEPDVAVIRGRPGEYQRRLPTGRDLVLVVEVSVTSQAFDIAKAGLYASAGVPEYWQLDVPRRRLRVHRKPAAEGEYQEISLLSEADAVPLPEIDATWTVSELLL